MVSNLYAKLDNAVMMIAVMITLIKNITSNS